MLGVRTKGTRSPGAEGRKAKCTGGGGTCQEALKLQPPSLVPLQLSQAAEPMARHADYMNGGHPACHLDCVSFRWHSSKEFSCQHRRHRFNPWVRKIPGGGHGNPLQYSSLENPMDRGVWQAIVLGVAKHQTQLRD